MALLNRREALVALASTSTLPLLFASTPAKNVHDDVGTNR